MSFRKPWLHHSQGKICPSAMSKIDFSGFSLDSVLMKVYLTQEKADKVVSACQNLLTKTCVSIRDVAQTIGFLVSCLPVVQFGPLLGGRRAYVDVAPTRKMDVFCFSFSLSSVSSLSPLGVAWPLNNGLAVIMT